MDQPKQKINLEPRLIKSGPEFEMRPGWGFKTGVWLRKYFWKTVAPILIILFIIYGLSNRNSSPDENTELIDSLLPTVNEMISMTIKKGDSRTLLARNALVQYLADYPENLSGAQKLFIETTLSHNMPALPLKIGKSANFEINEIEILIVKSKNLSPAQLEKWELLIR